MILTHLILFFFDGASDSAPVVVTPSKTATGGAPKKRRGYALTYKGETLLFESQEAIYAWFLKIDEAEVKEVKKKRYAMQNEFSGLDESLVLRNPSSPLRPRMSRFKMPLLRSRNMSDTNTARLCYRH